MLYDRDPRDLQIEAGVRFTNAMDAYAEALQAPKRRFGGGTELVDRFLDVEHALFFLHGPSQDEKEELTHGLAARGEQVAAERGAHTAVKHMQFFQERITDAGAIRRGEYPLVRTRIDHGEQHGAPETFQRFYRRPDGTEVMGPSSSIAEGIGRNGGIITLWPGETTSNPHPFRHLPPRPAQARGATTANVKRGV